MESVMFSPKQLLVAFKSLADSEDAPPGVGHCQWLDIQARRLGFNNYHDFRERLKAPAARMLGEVSIRLMERVCATKEPSRDDCAYYELIPIDGQIGFYSYWIGWDERGKEVRVPRPLSGRLSVPKRRKDTSSPVYVVESERELLAWQFGWNAAAYLPEDLAKDHFPSLFDRGHLIAANPPLELIRQKSHGREQVLLANMSM
jgi:hypothetical protein